MRPRPHPSHRERGTLSKAEYERLKAQEKAEREEAWRTWAEANPVAAQEAEELSARLIAELDREGE